MRPSSGRLHTYISGRGVTIRLDVISLVHHNLIDRSKETTRTTKQFGVKAFSDRSKETNNNNKTV